jgi:hypothetical protein
MIARSFRRHDLLSSFRFHPLRDPESGMQLEVASGSGNAFKARDAGMLSPGKWP